MTMGLVSAALLFVKVIPLGIYVRAACCKLDLPYLGCDDPLCPLAVGEPADCIPTANSAEQRAWCEREYVVWAQGLLDRVPPELGLGHELTCAPPTYTLLRAIGIIEVVGYVLLFVLPRLGAVILSAVMCAALHFHLVYKGDPPQSLILQFTLLTASLLVFFLSGLDAPRRHKDKLT